MNAPDLQPLDCAEVCLPNDPGFPLCQRMAIERICRRYPSHFVWIATADEPLDFIVDHEANRMQAQTLIFQHARDFRVWLVQYGRQSKADPYEPPVDPMVNRRRRVFARG